MTFCSSLKDTLFLRGLFLSRNGQTREGTPPPTTTTTPTTTRFPTTLEEEARLLRVCSRERERESALNVSMTTTTTKKTKKERKCARYRRYRDGATGKRFYFDVVAKTSSWRHPLFVHNEKRDDDDDDDDDAKKEGGGGKTKTTATTSSVFLAKEGIVEVRREEEDEDGQTDEENAWYRVDDRRLTRPYWFKNNETKERRWENPTKKKEEREEKREEEEKEEEEESEEDEDIEFDPDAYEDNDEEDRAEHEKTRLSREDRDDATRATTTSRENGPTLAAGVDDDKEEERDEDEDEDEPTTIAAADILNEKVRAKNKALNAFFALCEKAGINEHSRWERDMPKLRKLDKKAFECFATMPERRNAFNKYKVKLTSNAAAAAAAAAGTKKESKESKLEREQIAREKRKREILEKKRDDEYRLKKLRRNQDKGDAMKQFETLLSESIKAIDEVETFDDVRELLSQDPLGRASLDGPLSEADMVAAFDKFLLNFKTVSAQRYEELCQETVSALSQSVGGVAEEEDEVFAWEVARDVLKEDARFDRCPMKLRRSTFEKAIQNFRDQRIRNADASGAV